MQYDLRCSYKYVLVLVFLSALASLFINFGDVSAGAFLGRLYFTCAIALVALLLPLLQVVTITDTKVTRKSLFGTESTHAVHDVMLIEDDNEGAGWFVPTVKKITFKDGDFVNLIGVDPNLQAAALRHLRAVMQK